MSDNDMDNDSDLSNQIFLNSDYDASILIPDEELMNYILQYPFDEKKNLIIELSKYLTVYNSKDVLNSEVTTIVENTDALRNELENNVIMPINHSASEKASVKQRGRPCSKTCGSPANEVKISI